MKKIIIDCGSNTKVSTPLTEEELLVRQQEEATWEAEAGLRRRQATIQELARTDYVMARVTEDLIASLVEAGAISLGKLPDAAVMAMAQRKALRDRLGAI